MTNSRFRNACEFLTIFFFSSTSHLRNLSSIWYAHHLRIEFSTSSQIQTHEYLSYLSYFLSCYQFFDMLNVKRQVVVRKDLAIKVVNQKAARREDERLEQRLINEAHLLKTQMNSIASQQAFEQAFVQVVFRASLDDFSFDDRSRTFESHSDEVVSNSLIYRSSTDDKTVSWNRSLIRESIDSKDESIESDQSSQTSRHSKAESNQFVSFDTFQSNQIRSVQEFVRHNSRTSISTRRFEELIEAQLVELRSQFRFNRRSSSKFIHQTWNFNDVRQRVTLNRTQDVANAQQDVAQRIAFDLMNSSFTSAEENVMKFEFNFDDDVDNYVIWTRQQYLFRLKIFLRIDYTRIKSKIRWTNSINSSLEDNMHDNWIKDRFNVEILELQIENVKTVFEVIDLTKIAVSVKTDCQHVAITRLTLSDLLVESWVMMKIALIELWRQKLDYELKINVRCVNSVDSTLNAVVTFTIVDVSRSRRIRTVQLETITTIRNEQREEIDDYHARLINDYLCINDVCNNQNEFCYRKSNDHYRLIFNHLEIWANAISDDRDDASIDTSSLVMLDHMKRYQDSVDTRSRASVVAVNKLDRERKRQEEKKRREQNYQRRKNVQRRREEVEDRRITRENRFRDEIITEIEFRRLNSSVQIFSQYVSQMYNQFSLQYDDYSYSMQTFSYQSQSYSEGFSAFVTHSSSQISQQFVSQMTQQFASQMTQQTISSLTSQASVESTSQRESSSIEIDDEEKLIIEDFWRWKFFKKKFAEDRTRLVKIKHLLEKANLSIADIRRIFIEDSRMQIWALNQNISLDHINRFDENFRRYKSLWREAIREKRERKRERIQREESNELLSDSDDFLSQFSDDNLEEIDWFNIQNRRFLWQMNEFWIVRIRDLRINAWCERCRDSKSDFEVDFVDFVEW